jgi:hypothetical protein
VRALASSPNLLRLELQSLYFHLFLISVLLLLVLIWSFYHDYDMMFICFWCHVGQRLCDDTGRSTGIDSMETAGVLALALQQHRTLRSFHFYRKLK